MGVGLVVYDSYTMARQAISVTLDIENLTWLKGRVGAGGGRSVSDLLNQLVTEARASGRTGSGRSVVGTIDIDPADPLLEGADAAVRRLFERSTSRPIAVRERRARYDLTGKRRG
jgi:hypothetical protein